MLQQPIPPCFGEIYTSETLLFRIESEFARVREVLALYECVSGQKVNYAKSGLYFSPVTPTTLQANLRSMVGVSTIIDPAQQLLATHPYISVRFVQREANGVAHALANYASISSTPLDFQTVLPLLVQWSVLSWEEELEWASQHLKSSSPFLYSRKQFCTSPGENTTPNPGSTGVPPESKSGFPRAVIGSAVIVVGAALVAYRVGYLDQYLGEVPKSYVDSKKTGFDNKDEENIQVVASHNKEIKGLTPNVDLHEQEEATPIDFPSLLESSSETPGLNQPNAEGKLDGLDGTLGDSTMPGPEYSESSLPSGDHTADADVSAEGDLRNAEPEPALMPSKDIQDFQLDSQSSASLGEKEAKALEPHSHTTTDNLQDETSKDADTTSFALEESLIKAVPSLHPSTSNIPQDEQSKGAEVSSLAPKESQIKDFPFLHPAIADIPLAKPTEDRGAPNSLLDAYHLWDKADERYLASLNGKYEQLSKETEGFGTAVEELNEGYLSKDGKLVLSFLQAIHSAEKRQAELDAHAFAEEKQALKEKYEKELRNSRARELMRTEEAAILDKELKRERTKAAAAIKALQEKMEEKLRMELEEKEREAELKLQKAQELGKAELAAAIATEKAAQIEKVAEANLNRNSAARSLKQNSVVGFRDAGAEELKGKRPISRVDVVERKELLNKFHDGRTYKDTVVGVKKELDDLVEDDGTVASWEENSPDWSQRDVQEGQEEQLGDQSLSDSQDRTKVWVRGDKQGVDTVIDGNLKIIEGTKHMLVVDFCSAEVAPVGDVSS
ncbi:RNase L inhibitor protein-related isoform 1 [Hibiscus syriacus]|uniref:RNase L inhibitor protein-related isoform 1 n=1 Tax=Hibiscus syriacus TaxID=106335 RepID=A0A6A3CHN5_HIBSY|nr:RNase L inhibitor protein-related isoform 1 [Hibiscus syriacus]